MRCSTHARRAAHSSAASSPESFRPIGRSRYLFEVRRSIGVEQLGQRSQALDFQFPLTMPACPSWALLQSWSASPLGDIVDPTDLRRKAITIKSVAWARSNRRHAGLDSNCPVQRAMTGATKRDEIVTQFHDPIGHSCDGASRHASASKPPHRSHSRVRRPASRPVSRPLFPQREPRRAGHVVAIGGTRGELGGRTR